eukprot:CAMPEP_0181342716 /NCGR_PEP_ID=MMETSP1101-20121128/31162_1 /TAXON_ID=46948 /ORGANISM="Rhodomonas abbreviata, Strain Caron Lab Isolate" /LENGTH=41 /DNA_ID= /DNA_START= /DNA_END= /DNA_ORIENTATION=
MSWSKAAIPTDWERGRMPICANLRKVDSEAMPPPAHAPQRT